MASLLMLVGNGICTIPLALSVDGLPGQRRAAAARLRGARGRARGRRLPVLLPRAQRGDLAVVAPIIGLEGGIAALTVFAFGERVGVLVGRARDRALRRLPRGRAGGRRTAAGALPAAGAAVCFGADVRALRRGRGSRPRHGRGQRPPERAGAARRHRPLAPLPLPGRGDRCACSASAPSTPRPSSAIRTPPRGPVSVAAVVAGQFSTLSAVSGSCSCASGCGRTSTSASRSPASARRCSRLRSNGHSRAVANGAPTAARAARAAGTRRSAGRAPRCRRASGCRRRRARVALRAAPERVARGRSRPAGRRAGASSPDASTGTRGARRPAWAGPPPARRARARRPRRSCRPRSRRRRARQACASARPPRSARRARASRSRPSRTSWSHVPVETSWRVGRIGTTSGSASASTATCRTPRPASVDAPRPPLGQREAARDERRQHRRERVVGASLLEPEEDARRRRGERQRAQLRPAPEPDEPEHHEHGARAEERELLADVRRAAGRRMPSWRAGTRRSRARSSGA